MTRKRIPRILSFLLAAFFLLSCSFAEAEVYIDQKKPDDWEERDLLRIWALYALDCDAFVLECGGHVMLLDGGNGPKEKDLTDFLREKGWDHLDIIFNSHPHDDHIQAQYFAVLREKITADVFISPFRESFTSSEDMGLQQAMVKILKKRGIPYRQMLSGEELTLGEARMLLYRYDGSTRKPKGGSMLLNDMSGVLWVRYKDAAILLTSDIQGTIQQMLAEQYGAEGLKSDIMKAPHHGKNSLNDTLLKTVDPKLVLVTGKVNSTDACIRQMNNRKIPWKRTSYGTVVMETDGTDWYVNQEYRSEKIKKQEKLEQKKR